MSNEGKKWTESDLTELGTLLIRYPEGDENKLEIIGEIKRTAKNTIRTNW